MKRMHEKVAVVTGGSLGIGRATCERLAKEGAHVVVADIEDDAGEELVGQLVDGGHMASYLHLDVTDEDAVSAAMADIYREYRHIDVLVNNAGIAGANKPTHEVSLEEWENVMAVNVRGVFLCTKYAIPFMLEAGKGCIINLSSIYGIVSAPDIPPYHASKGAVRLMTKTDALVYAKDNIRVNSVHPGYIWTPLVENLARESGQDPEAFRQQLADRHPVGHVGEPEDIANGILYLASDEASFVTGAELVIDGGYTCR